MPDLFAPTEDDSVKITVAASTARVKIGDVSGRIQVRFCNLGTAPVWIKFGDATVTADLTNDIPVPANYVGGLTVNPPVSGGSLYVAAIAAGATGDIWFTPGTGI